jgi:hypothetical protein
MRTRLLLPILTVAAAAAASGAFAMPVPRHSGDVQYITGGVGQDEARAMQAQAHEWPLALEFAVQRGPRAEWLADVDVHITDRHGREVLNTTTDGPMLLARLAPGDYTIRADANGKTIERHVHVAPGQTAKSVLVWPAGTDVASR